jgi:hypothetical protein
MRALIRRIRASETHQTPSARSQAALQHRQHGVCVCVCVSSSTSTAGKDSCAHKQPSPRQINHCSITFLLCKLIAVALLSSKKSQLCIVQIVCHCCCTNVCILMVCNWSGGGRRREGHPEKNVDCQAGILTVVDSSMRAVANKALACSSCHTTHRTATPGTHRCLAVRPYTSKDAPACPHICGDHWGLHHTLSALLPSSQAPAKQ